jgi:S1-C subfamily serine protease
MNSIKQYIATIYCLLPLTALWLACAGSQKPDSAKGHQSTLSGELKQALRTVEQSIIGLDTKFEYDIFKYQYFLRDGQMVPDQTSAVGYKLETSKGQNGISVEKDSKTIQGGGLIIDVEPDRRRYTILTSSHLVAPKDTLNVFYRDSDDNPTDILFARFILRNVQITVRSRSNWLVPAELIFKDPVHDLAIIAATTDNNMGIEYPGKLGYEMDLGWGDWVFLFGFPKGIKQLTGGWVSKSPYRGNLTVDAVVKFGYSGGPVFAVNDRNHIAFVGLIRSVPRRFLEYIAPDQTLPTGYRLNPDDLNKLQVKTETLVEYGTAYFVDPPTINTFIESAGRALAEAGINLNQKYFSR